MNVFVVRGECDDYYCESEHLVAVATTAETAERLAEEARNVRYVYSNHPEPRRQHAPWCQVWVEEHELDTLKLDLGNCERVR